MAFKIKPFYPLNTTPIYRTLDTDGVLGVANKNGTIRIHKDVTDPAQLQEVIDHEMVHRDQMNPESNDTGRFAYDNYNMYYKPKGSKKTIVTKRSNKVDGAPYLGHEKEANDKKTQQKIKRKYNG
jgi:hypothetical protein|tara:strand:+ start:48 stop:422 length:375 start_codon:yes stop_codon:yes gene_type:complete